MRADAAGTDRVTDWFWQKADGFLAAIAVAIAGILACQGHGFLAQYVQRHGAETATARAHLTDVQSGLRYRVMGESVRAELETTAQARYSKLKKAENAIVGANVLTRPLMYVTYRDQTIAAATEQNFKPVLPSSAGSVLYTFGGMVLGFALYEVVKFPLVMLVREPRRRKFRRRG